MSQSDPRSADDKAVGLVRPRTMTRLIELAEAGLVNRDRLDEFDAVAQRYAIAISPTLADAIEPDNLNDPIALQFVPSLDELIQAPHERDDPIGDRKHEPVEGVVHRYPDRVLLKLVAVCPVYCRFCFRREMVGPGKDSNLSAAALSDALDYIRSHAEIWEVIVTGGDPFMVSARRAGDLMQSLEAIEHVKVVRWHTRMPVADPDRVDAAFVRAIRSSSKTVCVVAHVNHVRELGIGSRAALTRLADAGILLRSQSVLLKGINDSFDALSDLMRGLVEARVQPYYLHQMDMAPGTGHFRVELDRAQALVAELRDKLSGLCQPTFVIDIPGGVSKAVAANPDIRSTGTGYALRGRDGVWRDYVDPTRSTT